MRLSTAVSILASLRSYVSSPFRNTPGAPESRSHARAYLVAASANQEMREIRTCYVMIQAGFEAALGVESAPHDKYDEGNDE